MTAKPRTRQCVDRMIARRSMRLGGTYHKLGVLPWSTDPAWANLLWEDLRERGFSVVVGTHTGEVMGDVMNDDWEYGLTLEGTNWTQNDLIARLWLEVSSLERKSK